MCAVVQDIGRGAFQAFGAAGAKTIQIARKLVQDTDGLRNIVKLARAVIEASALQGYEACVIALKTFSDLTIGKGIFKSLDDFITGVAMYDRNGRFNPVQFLGRIAKLGCEIIGITRTCELLGFVASGTSKREVFKQTSVDQFENYFGFFEVGVNFANVVDDLCLNGGSCYNAIMTTASEVARTVGLVAFASGKLFVSNVAKGVGATLFITRFAIDNWNKK